MLRTTIVACALLAASVAVSASEPPVWSVDGGRLALSFSENITRSLGIRVEGRQARAGEILVEMPIGDQGSLEFLAPGGHFEKLLGGSLPLAGSLEISWPGGSTAGRVLRIAPAPGHPPALKLIDEDGGSWLTLEYGHFDLSGGGFAVEAIDLRLGSAFATALIAPELNGQWLGTARLQSTLQRPPEGTLTKGACTTPEWPTQAGADADLALTRMNFVNQVAALGGRVALAPSAYFRNVGSADLPWYGMFASPASDPDCIDSGDGTCEPYANDQGGILVYALYRFLDGRLEQLGRSAAKHAFNSVNIGCPPCSGGRIVWQGCEDIYNVGTNADRDFLGPRSEITAHTGVWQRSGSIFDPNSDGVCDHPSAPFLGSVRCMVPAADELERRLHVAESDLSTPGARYFVESWYVVRDDTDIFNSMGRREVLPTFSGSIWQFPFPVGGAFAQGPVVDQFFPTSGGPGFISERRETGTGWFQVVTRASDLGGGRYHYDLMIMNFDFDRQFRELRLPLPTGAQASDFIQEDGDDDPATDWTVFTSGTELSWRAPPGNGLDWGSLHTFGFEASYPPGEGSIELIPRESGFPASFTVPGLKLLDVIHRDGFEG